MVSKGHKRVWKTVKSLEKSWKSQGILKYKMSGNPAWVLGLDYSDCIFAYLYLSTFQLPTRWGQYPLPLTLMKKREEGKGRQRGVFYQRVPHKS